MTTKTTKSTPRKPRAPKPAPAPEATSEATTAPLPAAPASPATPPAALMSDDECAALFEALKPDKLELVNTLLDTMLRQQRRKQEAEWRAEYEREHQRKLKEARLMAKSHELDAVERMSLHLIGELAMSFDLTRDSLYDGALDGLFRTINRTLRTGLARADEWELSVIREAGRSGVSTQGWLASDDDDDPVDAGDDDAGPDDESDDDGVDDAA